MTKQDHFHDFLYAAALCLVVAVALFIAGAIFLSSGALGGLSGRDRIELVSQQGANVITATLLLGAVAALFQVPADRARPIAIAALLVGGVIVLLALYSIGDIMTLHVPGPDVQGASSFGLARGDLNSRLGTLLPQVAALLLALVAMVGANRLGNLVNESRGTSGGPPG